MKLCVLDTSALAKLYLKEKGTRRLRRLLEDARDDPPIARLFVSRLVLPETMSAIQRSENRGALTAGGARRLRMRLYLDFTGSELQYDIIEPGITVVNRAALLVAQHGLRGFDAVHLASALSLVPALGSGDELVFVTSDKSLAKAARAHRLTAKDPTVR